MSVHSYNAFTDKGLFITTTVTTPPYSDEENSEEIQNVDSSSEEENSKEIQNVDSCSEEESAGEPETDSEDSLGGAEFDWVVVEFDAKEGKIVSADNFMAWLGNPSYKNSKGSLEMNCMQGVVYYIHQHDGGNLVEKIRARYCEIKRQERDPARARYRLDLEFSSFLGLDQAEGPFDIDKVDEVWKNNQMPPGSVISFGTRTDEIHVVVVTKKRKIRSLWVHPFQDGKAPFGKYDYQLVFDQIKTGYFDKVTQKELEELNASPVFYVSTRFCPCLLDLISKTLAISSPNAACASGKSQAG